MNVIVIPPGQSWLRVRLVTPSNYGSSAGRATLDRPVALHPWTELPFLPFSGLSGVLAGRLGGDVWLDSQQSRLNTSRTDIFGSPDHQTTPGKPGDLVFGDGEILCFPAPIGGRIAHVVPLSTVAWLSRFGLLKCVVPTPGRGATAYTWLSGFRSDIVPDGDPAIVPTLLGAVAPLIQSPAAMIMVAEAEAARSLWRLATEIRSLTALETELKRAMGGTLRRIELIPSGSSFIALVTNASGEAIDLGSDRLQLGGWESWGCGYVRAEVVSQVPAVSSDEESFPTGATPAPRDEELMVRAFRAIRDAPAELRAKLRPLLREVGPRFRTQGVAPTLSFSLAKARFQATKETLERKAHRWLLATLFPGNDVRSATVEAIRGDRPADHLELLCHWLSRYAELIAYDGQIAPISTAEGE